MKIHLLLLCLVLIPFVRAENYDVEGNFSLLGHGNIEFFGNGTVTIEGHHMKLCIREGEILNQSGKWFAEDDCMETRKGRIIVQAVDVALSADRVHIEAEVDAWVHLGGTWIFRRNLNKQYKPQLLP